MDRAPCTLLEQQHDRPGLAAEGSDAQSSTTACIHGIYTRSCLDQRSCSSCLAALASNVQCGAAIDAAPGVNTAGMRSGSYCQL